MIAILYPLKMDKNLSEAYSKIYEMRTSLDDYGTPEKRQATKNQVEINKKVNKYGGKTPSGTSAVDAKKGLDDTINSSHEPEGTMVEGQKYGLTKGTGKASGAYKKYLENAKKMQEADKKKKKTGNPAFDDPSHHSFAKYKTRNEGKYRSEWEELKLMEMKDYVSEFDVWLTGLVEEGYDIDRWTDEDMFETFINEHNLWGVKETVLEALATIEESDKKGKGSGSKDACYHKVKSRYSVWPSAYASGALVKCRKKGAKNWGNSSKKEGFSDWRDDLGLLDENRATAYTAGMSDEQKDVEMRKISPKVAKEAGKSHDKFMFSSRKKGGKFNKDYNKNVLKDKKYNQNTTGRGTPVSYRKGYEDQDLGRYQSKIRQGEGSIKDLGKKK